MQKMENILNSTSEKTGGAGKIESKEIMERCRLPDYRKTEK